MLERKTCEVIIEINEKLMSSSQEQLIFQWVMQHIHRYLILIVYTEAGEAAVPRLLAGSGNHYVFKTKTRTEDN